MIQVIAVEEATTVVVVASLMAAEVARVGRMAAAATLNKAEKAVEEEAAGRPSRILVRLLAKLR